MKDDECRDTSTNFSTVEIVKQQTKEQKTNAMRDGEYVCGSSSRPLAATSAENAARRRSLSLHCSRWTSWPLPRTSHNWTDNAATRSRATRFDLWTLEFRDAQWGKKEFVEILEGKLKCREGKVTKIKNIMASGPNFKIFIVLVAKTFHDFIKKVWN